MFNDALLSGRIRIASTTRVVLANPFNYARFFLPTLLPAGFRGRVVYLDDDVIVRGDVAELARTPLQSGHVAAFSSDRSWVSAAYNYKAVRLTQAHTRVGTSLLADPPSLLLAMGDW